MGEGKVSMGLEAPRIVVIDDGDQGAPVEVNKYREMYDGTF